MKLGDHTIGLRTRQVIGRNDRGSDVYADVDVEVPWCLVTPTRSTEDQDNRTAPITGLQLLAPPGTPVGAADAVIWPITSRTTTDGQLQLTGPLYEVDGDPGEWDECVEAQLQRMGS